MNVTCPSCQTRFRLAPDRIAPSGARVRCSACKGVFRLSRSGEVSPDGPVEASPIAAAVRPFGVAATRAGPPAFPAADPFAPPAPSAAEALRAMLDALPPPGPAAAPPPGTASGALALEDWPPAPRAVPPPLAGRTPAPSAAGAGADAAPGAPSGGELAFTPTPRAEAAPPAGAPAPPATAGRPAAAGASPGPEPAIASVTTALPKLRRPGLAAVAGNALSLALLLALAAGLLAWRVEAGRRGRGLSGGAAGAVVPGAVRAGLYDADGGAAVLVVRGEVRAERGIQGPVRVHVTLVDGGRTVAAADALAGASASAEEVHAAATVEQAAALRRALDAGAVAALPAGGAAPFLIVFPPPLPDLTGVEVRTAAEAAPRP